MAGEGGFDAASLVAATERRIRELRVDAVPPLVQRPQQVCSLLAPKHVLLGPRHWDQHTDRKKHLKKESHKLRCLEDLLLKASRNNDNRGRQELLSHLTQRVNQELDNDAQARHGCDALPRDELVWRMLLDGCYIVHTFRNYPRAPTNNNNNPPAPANGVVVGANLRPPAAAAVGDSTTIKASEWRDTWFLVDNCVPYGVVNVINQVVYADRREEGLRASEAARRLLQRWYFCSYSSPLPRELPQQPGGGANYLLRLLAELLKPKYPNPSSLPPPQEEEEQDLEGAAADQLWTRQWQRATEYVRCCNARFVASRLDGKDRLSVLDVTASVRGCLRCIDVRVPRLLIDDNVLALLWNLVELEKRILIRPYVTAYCFFMYKLASQPEDVEFLQREGIIYHAYNDPKDVVKGLKRVVDGVNARDLDYLLPIAKELGRRFYESTIHRRLSWFRVSYWTKGDVLALMAVFFAVLTIFAGVPDIVFGALSASRHQEAAVVLALAPPPSGHH